MTLYLTVMGWAATVVLAVSFTIALVVAALARRPQVGDDVIAMHARWRDEKVAAELERILSEGDGRG